MKLFLYWFSFSLFFHTCAGLYGCWLPQPQARWWTAHWYGWQELGWDLHRLMGKRVDKLKSLKLIKLKIIRFCRYKWPCSCDLIFRVSSHTRFKIKASEWHQCWYPRAVLVVEYSWSHMGGFRSKMQKKPKGNYVMQNSLPAILNDGRISGISVIKIVPTKYHYHHWHQ